MRGGWRDQADGVLGPEWCPGGSRAGQRDLWQSRWPREPRRLWKVAMSQANTPGDRSTKAGTYSQLRHLRTTTALLLVAERTQLWTVQTVTPTSAPM